MEKFRSIELIYATADGQNLSGDLWLPLHPVGSTVVLLIHGGGWSNLDRHSTDGVAAYLVEQNWAVFNIDYRLSTVAPWPACGVDCLAAAQFLLAQAAPQLAGWPIQHLVLCGLSAGGHLALMTGLQLPVQQVSGIVSISGIADLECDYALHPERYKMLFHDAVTLEKIQAAAPVNYLRSDSPPLLLTHNTFDQVVPVSSPRRFREAGLRRGAHIDLYEYCATEKDHGIWVPGTQPHQLYPHLEMVVSGFLTRIVSP